MTAIEKAEKAAYDNRKIAEIEADLRKQNIRYNQTQWFQRGYTIRPDQLGDSYTYYCPTTHCEMGGIRYSIDQVERRRCKRPLHRLKYGF